jgi:hypothetical protein
MRLENKKKDLPSHVARLHGLDISRSTRIYKTLSKLSIKAVEALKAKNMRSFSFFSDKMRQLLNYINLNAVRLTQHLSEDNFRNETENGSYYSEIKDTVPILRQNLKIIDDSRKAMSSIPFHSSMFAYQDITNAYLDYVIPLVWDFEFDAIILINLDDVRLLDYLVQRGQRRFFLIGSSLDDETIIASLNKDGILFWAYKDESIIMDMFMSVTGKPPGKFITIDCGSEKQDPKIMQKILSDAEQGRTANWHRFNTVNRADAVNILDNLNNLVSYQQASDFHGKFRDMPAVIVSPGPSLEKNIHILKKMGGKAVIITVLRALGTLLDNQIVPDIVVQVDPHNLREMLSEQGDTSSNFWSEWIDKNDFSKVKIFISTMYGHSSIFDVPAQKTLWMNPSMPLKGHLPLDIFDYTRTGGSVAHSAFDIAIELGCTSIALVGQDLAYSRDNNVYAAGAATHRKGDEISFSKFGEDIEVEGSDGKPIMTNNVFLNFARHFTYFSEGLQETNIKLFNCTEGGLFVEGFTHCKLKIFLEKECTKSIESQIKEIIKETTQNPIARKQRFDCMKKYIGKNISLAENISLRLLKLKRIIKRETFSEIDLEKFDKLQHKIINLMGSNYFYTIALQKDTHILQAGLKADSSIESQIGFHSDFLKAVETVNNRFKSSLSKQRKLFMRESAGLYQIK